MLRNISISWLKKRKQRACLEGDNQYDEGCVVCDVWSVKDSRQPVASRLRSALPQAQCWGSPWNLLIVRVTAEYLATTGSYCLDESMVKPVWAFYWQQEGVEVEAQQEEEKQRWWAQVASSTVSPWGRLQLPEERVLQDCTSCPVTPVTYKVCPSIGDREGNVFGCMLGGKKKKRKKSSKPR